MANNIGVISKIEAINSLTPHPANPRMGNTTLIAESLREHGQYRPIVAQVSTRFILAGNHTWRAARVLGWKEIAVSWLDVDDETARRVLIADNRLTDLASYDNQNLIELLTSLPTLDSSGYDARDVENLKQLADTGGGGGGADKMPAQRPDIHLGRYDFWLQSEELNALRSRVDQKQKPATIDYLRATLGFPPEAPKTVARADTTPRVPQSADLVAIDSVQPFPNNPRQGDIGAISESLRHLGQFRPLVVNQRTNRILVGNHTWYAAKSLGWTDIAIVTVDLDENAELALVLIDNRTSDLATYDDTALLNLLTTTPLTGTGFSGDDLDELLSDVTNERHHRNPAKTSAVSCRVDKWAWKVAYADFDAWDNADDQYAVIAERLNLNPNQWTTESPL